HKRVYCGEGFEVDDVFGGVGVVDQGLPDLRGADIGLAADRGEPGDAESAASRQCGDLGAELPGLGDHGQRARCEVAPGQQQLIGRVDESQRIRPDQPGTGGDDPGCEVLGVRHACGDDEEGAHACGQRLVDGGGHRGPGGGGDEEFGDLG